MYVIFRDEKERKKHENGNDASYVVRFHKVAKRKKQRRERWEKGEKMDSNISLVHIGHSLISLIKN